MRLSFSALIVIQLVSHPICSFGSLSEPYSLYCLVNGEVLTER